MCTHGILSHALKEERADMTHVIRTHGAGEREEGTKSGHVQ